MSNFVPLHIVSGYSFLQSGLTIKKIQKALTTYNFVGLGLTDFNVLHGVPEMVEMMVKLNKPYIIGMEVIFEEFHLCLFVKDERGYENLLCINSYLQKEALNHSFLSQHNEGLIGIFKTKQDSFINKIKENELSFKRWLLNLSNLFKDDFYLGLDIASKEDKDNATLIRDFAKEYTYKTIAFPCIKYYKKDDAIIIDIVNAISSGETLKITSKSGYECFLNPDSYKKIYSDVEIENTEKVLKSSHFEFNKKRGSLLHINDNDNEVFHNIIHQKLIDKGLSNIKEYQERLDYEEKVIIDLGYSSYFLIVQEYTSWARQNNILVGPGRGSAAGSLVSYLLDITEIDPLKYNLQFERFLNPYRKTMPDIDIDFMDIRRHEVINHMIETYGQNRVSNIVAFQTIQAKQALRDIGRIYNYPEHHIVLLIKALNPKGQKLENKTVTLGVAYKYLKDFAKLVDSDEYFKTIVSLAGKIEGLPRQSGLHAAGIILNSKPIEECMPVTYDFSDNRISQYEYSYLENQGFLKMDFLGLRNLTTIMYCYELIKEKEPTFPYSPYTIPFEDKSVFELISSGNNIGLFQIETSVMKRGLKIIKPTCFDDVVALLALNRPGPMQYLEEYALRKEGKKKITYLDKRLEPILSSTYGIIIYQEQINDISTTIAGFSKGEADLFRRAISKKDKSILLEKEQEFISGAIKNGLDRNKAKEIFDTIKNFANYGFNKSHSVVYSVITCRMAYLKAHYPLEFFRAILETGASNETKFIDYIKEMKELNIDILPPDINKSGKRFLRLNDSLLMPLTSIKDINEQTINNIINERNNNGEFKDFFDFIIRMHQFHINENYIVRLIESGSFDEFYKSRKSMIVTIKSALQYAELNSFSNGQLNIGISSIEPPKMIIMKDDPFENYEREKEAIGVALSTNPITYIRDLLDESLITEISKLEFNQLKTVIAVIQSEKTITTKNGDRMSFLEVYDETSTLEATIFPECYKKYCDLLRVNNIVFLQGKLTKRNDEHSFIVENIEEYKEQMEEEDV